MRKEIIAPNAATSPSFSSELELTTLATVAVTSEMVEHPVENAFDHRRGPGGSHWVADSPGEQTLILAFDRPQILHRCLLEVEELREERTQELQLAISRDGGNTYEERVRQEFNFSPSGTTFEREEWALEVEAVTHLRLCIKPDKGGRPRQASITTLALQ